MATEAWIVVKETGLRQVTRGFGDASRSVGRFERASRSFGRGLSGVTRLIGRASAAAGALGVAFGARTVLEFDETLGKLQGTARLTNKQAFALRNRILKLNQTFTIGKDKYAAALQVFQDFGGILPQGAETLGTLGKIAKATGTEMADLAKVAATMIGTLGQSPKQAERTVAALNAQAERGTIAMSDLARTLPEIAATARSSGQDILSMGAAMQAVGRAVGGNADRAKFALIALMAQLEQNSKAIKKSLGIEVFRIDPKTGAQVLRDVGDLMAEILRATGGQVTGKKGLNKFFNLESRRALKGFQSSFNLQTGAYRRTGDYAATRAAGRGDVFGVLETQFQRRVQGVAAEAEKLRQALAKVEAQFLDFGKRALANVVANPGRALALSVGGAAALKFGPTLIGALVKRLMTRRGGAGGLQGLAGASGGRGIPVYVTNLPGASSMIGGAATTATAVKPKRRLLALGGASLTAGYAIGTALDQTFGISDAISDWAVGRSGPIATARRSKLQREAGSEALVRQAGALAGLAKRGVTSFGAAGNQQALTQGNVLAALRANADKQGLTAAEFAKLLPILERLTSRIGTTNVTVAAPGIDSPRVAVTRNAGAP